MNFENYDPLFPDQPVVDLYLPLWANLPSFMSKPAFIWAEDDGLSASASSMLTYEQLNKSVQSISSQLLLQLKRGDSVLILCAPGLELVEVIFGCQRAGLLAVPIIPPHPSFTEDNYHHLLRAISQTKPKAAIANHGYMQLVKRYISSPSCSRNERLSQQLQQLKWISIQNIIRDQRFYHSPLSTSSYNGRKPEEVYLIQYTSGATGIPKPVLVTAGAASHNVRAARKDYDLHPNSVIVSWLPQYHDCGLMFLLLTIVSGATCVLASPTAFIKRPRIWLELISEYRATCSPVPSFALPLVVRRGGIAQGIVPIDLSSMKHLIIVNEPIYKTAIAEFVQVLSPFGLNSSAISPSYGLAENCTFVSTAWRSGETGSLPTYKKLLPSARLDSQLEGGGDEEIKILIVNEETQEPVEDGTEGEIWISSPSNASGYLGHPSLTKDVFHRMIRNKLSLPFVRTGDRGIVMGDERYLFVTGRTSDIIKLPNNQELHPHYIETAAYNSCPKSLRGGCLAAFLVSQTIVIVAEMQRSDGETKFLRNICEGIRKNVMEVENVEVGLVVLVKVGSVPKTTSGKIQRWLAKDKLIRGKMNKMMQVKFQDYDFEANIKTMMNTGNEGKVGLDKGKRRSKTMVEQIEEIHLSLSEAPSYLSRLSSL